MTPPMPPKSIDTQVRVCRLCSTLEPTTTPHGEGCNSRDWMTVPLVDGIAGQSRIVPGDDEGWPEVEVTLAFMVHSDDPTVLEQVRGELLEKAEDWLIRGGGPDA